MVKGLGLDLCEISRMDKLLENDRFLNRYYTEEEKNKVAEILIKYGVDASGTEYEKSYDAYWSSIIK